MSDSSGTDSAGFDDNGLYQELEGFLDNPQYINLKTPPADVTEVNSDKSNTYTLSEADLSILKPYLDIVFGKEKPVPVEMLNQGVQYSSDQNSLGQPQPLLQKPTPSTSFAKQPPIAPSALTSSSRALQDVNSSSKSFSTPSQEQTIQSVQEVFKKLRNNRCALETCAKKPAVPCPTCKQLIYCTDKHRKAAKKSHEARCNASRQIETKALGLHTIAARDINRGSVLIEKEEPLLVLPLNPDVNSRKFPSSFCVKCFENFEPNSQMSCLSSESERQKCPQCQLPICQVLCTPAYSKRAVDIDHRMRERMPPHSEFECKVFKSAAFRSVGKQKILIQDQSVLGMLRCVPLLKNGFDDNDDDDKFFELMNMIKMEGYTKNFRSKLQLVRSLLLIDASTVSDENLYKTDQVLLRFGRNIGSDSVTFTFHEIRPLFPTYARCIYPKMAHVVHSCVPNCILVVLDNLCVCLVAIKEIKKGEVLTFCYDERVLFMQTRERRNFFLDQFGINCKCKRCLSQSELDTYFSAFPCSRPHCRGFIVPGNPLDRFSNWMCDKCKRTPVSYLRIIDAAFTFQEQLAKPMKKGDPLGVLTVMENLVDKNYLHWNHHIIFHASMELFSILWIALNKNDLKVMEAYSKYHGLQFLKPAESAINITQTFMPDGFSSKYILPLRLASLIKLRHLTDQLSRKEITLEKVNDAINAMYFRAYDISKRPLYERSVPNQSLSMEQNLKVMEMNVVNALMKSIMPIHGVNYKVKARALERMYDTKRKDIIILERIKDKRGCIGIFPWDMNV